MSWRREKPGVSAKVAEDTKNEHELSSPSRTTFPDFSRKLHKDMMEKAETTNQKNLTLERHDRLGSVDEENYPFPEDELREMSMVSTLSTHRNRRGWCANNIVLRPDSWKRLSWDLLIFALLLFVAFYLPVRVGFLQDDEDVPMGLLRAEDFVDAMFGADILLNFVTAVRDEDSGALNYSLKDIAVSYLKGYFVIDFVASFPFDRVSESTGSSSGAQRAGKLTRLPRLMRFMKMMRLLKLLRFYKVNDYLMKLEIRYGLHQGLSQVLLIVGIILVATHLVGCMWHFIATEDTWAAHCACEVAGDCAAYELLDDPSPLPSAALYCPWVWRLGYWDRARGQRYVAGLYWALSSLTTVGYGDISGATESEQLYCMFVMAVGVSWYAYIVSSMTTVMASFDDKQRLVMDRLNALQAFCRDHKLPPPLARRLKAHTEYMLHQNPWFSVTGGYHAEAIVRDLTPQLRNEVILSVEQTTIQKIPFFNDKDPALVAELCMALSPRRMEANVHLTHEGQPADELFFLTKGMVGLYVQTEDGLKKYRQYFEGSPVFGDLGCVVGGTYEYTLRAMTPCQVQVISKKNLLGILGGNPKVFEELRQSAITMRNRLLLFKGGNLEEKMRVVEEETQDAKMLGYTSKRMKDLKKLGSKNALGQSKHIINDHLDGASSELQESPQIQATKFLSNLSGGIKQILRIKSNRQEEPRSAALATSHKQHAFLIHGSHNNTPRSNKENSLGFFDEESRPNKSYQADEDAEQTKETREEEVEIDLTPFSTTSGKKVPWETQIPKSPLQEALVGFIGGRESTTKQKPDVKTYTGRQQAPNKDSQSQPSLATFASAEAAPAKSRRESSAFGKGTEDNDDEGEDEPGRRRRSSGAAAAAAAAPLQPTSLRHRLRQQSISVILLGAEEEGGGEGEGAERRRRGARRRGRRAAPAPPPAEWSSSASSVSLAGEEEEEEEEERGPTGRRRRRRRRLAALVEREVDRALAAALPRFEREVETAVGRAVERVVMRARQQRGAQDASVP